MENCDFLNLPSFIYLPPTNSIRYFWKDCLRVCAVRAVLLAFASCISSRQIQSDIKAPILWYWRSFDQGKLWKLGFLIWHRKGASKLKYLFWSSFKDIKNSALSGKRSVIAKRKRASFDVENKLACLLNCVLNLLFKHFLTASQEWKNNDDGSYFMHLFSQTIGIIHCWA